MLRLKNICLEHMLFKCNLATKMLKKKKGEDFNSGLYST